MEGETVGREIVHRNTDRKQPKPNERGRVMGYELKKCYEFTFSRFDSWNGKNYLVLKDADGRETIAGYEANKWVFRVPTLPFQDEWGEAEARAWGPFKCYVSAFMYDPDTKWETTFPVMRQDWNATNEKLYGGMDADSRVGFIAQEQYDDKDKSGLPVHGWTVCDMQTGFPYNIPLEKFGEDVPTCPGQSLDFYPEKSKKGIRFKTAAEHEADLEALRLPELVGVGQVATCTVASVDHSRFVFLKYPKVKRPLRIAKPQNGSVPTVGEKVQVKCTGFDGLWPCLAWEGKYAQCDIPVDALPPLVLPSGVESENLEYKSSLVYPAGAEEADVDKQLATEIIPVVASFMNCSGGNLYIGVRNDGTICGIEKEGVLLNKDSDDEFTYPTNPDGMMQKIVNTINRQLGVAAGALVKVSFKKGVNTSHLVCEIQVPPSETELPVFVDGKILYARLCGQTRSLYGIQAARFIIERLRKLDKSRGTDGTASIDQEKLAEMIARHFQNRPSSAPLELDANESVPLEAECVSAVTPRGLVFDGRFRGEAKSWSDLYLRLLETLAVVDGEKFEGLPDEPAFVKGKYVMFARKKEKGRGPRLRQDSFSFNNYRRYLGPKEDVRADLAVGTRTAFTPPKGRVFPLIAHFGLKPEQFRIWTGPDVQA